MHCTGIDRDHKRKRKRPQTVWRNGGKWVQFHGSNMDGMAQHLSEANRRYPYSIAPSCHQLKENISRRRCTTCTTMLHQGKKEGAKRRGGRKKGKARRGAISNQKLCLPHESNMGLLGAVIMIISLLSEPTTTSCTDHYTRQTIEQIPTILIICYMNLILSSVVLPQSPISTFTLLLLINIITV